MSEARKVEIFLGPVAVTCAGGPTPAKQEKITRAFALKGALEKEHSADYEVITWDLGKDEDYERGLGVLQGYLREAGEGDTADSIAFALNSVTPSVAVEGRLLYINECPEVDEFFRIEVRPPGGGG